MRQIFMSHGHYSVVIVATSVLLSLTIPMSESRLCRGRISMFNVAFRSFNANRQRAIDNTSYRIVVVLLTGKG